MEGLQQALSNGMSQAGGSGGDGERVAAGAAPTLTPTDAQRRFEASLEAALAMAQRALVVRRDAIDTLLGEVGALRRENDALAASIGDPSVGALRQRLHYLEVEIAEERSARTAAERELAETAEATYEMWEAFRDWMGSDRGTSAPGSREASPPEGSAHASGAAAAGASAASATGVPGWRTPPPPGRGATPSALSWRSAASASPVPGGGSGAPSPRVLYAGSGGGAPGVSPRDRLPAFPTLSPRASGAGGTAPLDPATLERRAKALADKLQGMDLQRRGDADTAGARDRAAAESGTTGGGGAGAAAACGNGKARTVPALAGI